VRKTQPDGGASGDGSSPTSARFARARRERRLAARGVDARRAREQGARVYGGAARREMRGFGARSMTGRGT
jgi:hypothetical protein